MRGRTNQIDQLAAITKVIEITPYAVEIRGHVQQIIDHPVFRSSRRSQEFIQFIVEKALDGQFEALKERTIGVELFGRSPAYDTGEDAIVRVTACEVRKRLAQFYSEFGAHAEFRVELLPGSYIPEFRKLPAFQPPSAEKFIQQIENFPTDSHIAPESAEVTPVNTAPANVKRSYPWMLIAAFLGAGGCLLLALWALNLLHLGLPNEAPLNQLPWSAIVQSNRQTHLIFCDPEIVTIQRVLNFSISLSDYANQHYWPSAVPSHLESQKTLQELHFRGASVAAVDAGVALNIANLIASGAKHPMQPHMARNIRLGDFKTEDNFILLGSPRSNPWIELFQDQLDFSFAFDSVRHSEFIREKSRGSGEGRRYLPTAEGWETGHAYAIIALVANPNQSGTVLLIAGSNAEATEAAGKLATNPDQIAQALKGSGINPAGPLRHFEILLQVSTMAGSPNTFQVITCRPLS